MAINLCHWLREGELEKMEERIHHAMPHLFLVSINGADKEGGWDRLIQTLDRGQFDVYRFLTALHKAGYRGPVGLQCYGVQGDRRENLNRSIEAWRKMNRRFAAE
jgi:sugar phosphate isomerase/epimerase